MAGLNAKPQRAAAPAELSLLTQVIQTTEEPVSPVRKWQLYGLNKDSRKKKKYKLREADYKQLQE